MLMKTDLRIAAFGSPADSFGGWALRKILNRRLSERFPNAHAAHFCLGHQSAGDDNEVPWCVKQHFPSGPDAVIVGGGNLLDLSVDRVATDYEGPYPPAASLWLIPALLAERWHVPLLWNAPGAPRDFRADEAPFVSKACEPVTWRAVRDPLTSASLAQQGIDNVHVVPDTRVLMDELWQGERWDKARAQAMLPKSAGRTLCVQVSRDYYDRNGDILLEQLQLLLDGTFSHVLLLALSPGEIQSQRALRQGLGNRATFVGLPGDAYELAAIVSAVDLVVTTSLHVSLTALTLHRPHVALPGCRKLDGYRQWLQPGTTIGVDPLSDAVACAMAQQPRLPEIHARMRQAAMDHFERFLALTGSGGSRGCRTIPFWGWDESGLKLPGCDRLLHQLEQHTVSSLWQRLRHDRQVTRQLGDQGLHRRAELHETREALQVVTNSVPYRLLKTFGYAYERRRYLTPSASRLLRPLAWVVDAVCRLAGRPVGLWLDRLPFIDPPLYWLYKPEIMRAIGNRLLDDATALTRLSSPPKPSKWFGRYRPSPAVLQEIRKRPRPFAAPRFSVLVVLDDSDTAWLKDTLASVVAQTYGGWEIIGLCRTTASVQQREAFTAFADDDPEGHRFTLLQNVGQWLEESRMDWANGDFLCLTRQGDALEPQALDRLVDAISRDGADMVYADEVLTGEDLDTVHEVKTRPAFSLYHYLSHAYFHPLALRAAHVRDVGGLGKTFEPTGADLVLRLLERPLVVSHVADVLYRRRSTGTATSADEARAHHEAVRRWLSRQNVTAEVRSTDQPSCLNVAFPVSGRERVAIIIPTKNGFEHLRCCLTGLRATVPSDLADVIVVDHESDDPRVLALLDQAKQEHRVLAYQGPFNYSAINNYAVSRLEGQYSHYLFLNNDVEPVAPGWLEHMLGYGARPDVGAVGALLIYPDRTVQHAGVWAGMYWGACHPYRYAPVYGEGGTRQSGLDMTLLATRELSAVTGACLLVQADAFHHVGRFDAALGVGFNDVDLCLRIGTLGKKVVFDAHAVLIHHESVTRGKSKTDPHPADTQRFRMRYLERILAGDPYASPFRSRYAPDSLNPSARCLRQTMTRTVSFVPAPQEHAGEVSEALRAVA